MNKYKIGKYIVKADSIHDAVTIVKTIKNSIKDGKYVSELKPGDVITKKDGSKWDVALVRHTPFGIQVRMNSKTSPVKTEEITYRPTDMLAYDSVKDSRRINYDDDIIEVTLNGKVVFRGYAEDWLDNNFDSNFKWTGSQYEASNAKGKWVVRVIDSSRDSRTISPWALSPGKRILSEDGDKATVVSVKGDRRNGYDVVVKFDDGSTDKWYYMPDDVITVIDSGKKIGTMTDTVEKTGDSFQKDSLTVRDVIQSLINEETSAISSYNVALETLKDHIPAEAYEAIKAIRDDEQRHVENLYAVLNGNVTPKNLEN